jgi:hypothetical protein
MYDYPYRVEYNPKGTKENYDVVHTGEGVICQGENLSELRKLVEAANEMVAVSDDRGR